MGYNPINENNRIIKQATVSTSEGGIILNVATTDNTGNLTPLSPVYGIQRLLREFYTIGIQSIYTEPRTGYINIP